MAIASTTVWESRPSTGDDNNGAGFNPANSSMATDLAATGGTSASPVVSSASYTFVAGDVGSLLFVKSGSNWIPGWYPIVSVSGGAATLDASVGAVSLYGGATLLNTSAGVATVASPSSATWTIDYSQQASAGKAYTDLVIGATTTRFTSAALPVGKNLVGNIVYVRSGTGFTTGRYEVVSTSGTTATCDRSLGTAASTGGIGNLGGSAQTQDEIIARGWAAKNRLYTKAESTIVRTATLTIMPGSGGGDFLGDTNRIIGYSSYRGDGGRVTVQLSTNTGLAAFALNANGISLENFDIDCNNLGSSSGVTNTSSTQEVYNCKVSNFTSVGINLTNGGSNRVSRCEVTGGGSAATAGIRLLAGWILENNVHDNDCPGIAAGACTVQFNRVVNNAASSAGILAGASCVITNNTVYGSGSHGISITSNAQIGTLYIKNNLLVNNGGYGIKFAANAIPAEAAFDGNAYYNNTSGTRNNGDSVAGSSGFAVAPYINSLDVILTDDPFSNAAGGDFSLNNTAGAGAAARGTAQPSNFPGASETGYMDFGTIQSQASGGGGIIPVDFDGGMRS